LITMLSMATGRTATVIDDECTRPRFSLGGTLCHRCPPGSPANSSAAQSPLIISAQNPSRSSINSSQSLLALQARS
jgi:hypothetical protein